MGWEYDAASEVLTVDGRSFTMGTARDLCRAWLGGDLYHIQRTGALLDDPRPLGWEVSFVGPNGPERRQVADLDLEPMLRNQWTDRHASKLVQSLLEAEKCQ